jgi:hypothetical protein
MPFFAVLEFSLTSKDGKPCDPATAGRIRITDDGKNVKVHVKPCADRAGVFGTDWREAEKGELDFLKRVYEAYTNFQK